MSEFISLALASGFCRPVVQLLVASVVCDLAGQAVDQGREPCLILVALDAAGDTVIESQTMSLPFDAYIGARLSFRQAEWSLLGGLTGARCPGWSLKIAALSGP